MRWFYLFNIFTILISLSVSQVHGSCHDTLENIEGDSHSSMPCHQEDDSESHNEESSNECKMFCCHFAVDNPQYYILSEEIAVISYLQIFDQPRSNIKNVQFDLFRPPIV